MISAGLVYAVLSLAAVGRPAQPRSVGPADTTLHPLLLTLRRQPMAVTASFTLEAPGTLVAIRWRRGWPDIPDSDPWPNRAGGVLSIGEHHVSFRRQGPEQVGVVGGALPVGQRPRDVHWRTDFAVTIPPGFASGPYEVLLLVTHAPVPPEEQRAALAEVGGPESVTVLARALAARWSRPGTPARWAVVHVPPTL